MVEEKIHENNAKVQSCTQFVQEADIRFAKLETSDRKMNRAVDEMYPLVIDFDERLVTI
jgi:hypothetical protein